MMERDKNCFERGRSSKKYLPAEFQISEYIFTVSVQRRTKLNKFGQFLSLNHDANKIRDYLEQCVKIGNFEPHDVFSVEGVPSFSILSVDKISESG